MEMLQSTMQHIFFNILVIWHVMMGTDVLQSMISNIVFVRFCDDLKVTLGPEMSWMRCNFRFLLFTEDFGNLMLGTEILEIPSKHYF